MPCLGDNISLLLLQIASDKETFVVVGSSANIRPDWILLQAGRSQVLPKQIICERANYAASRIKCVFRERNGMTGNMGNLWEAVCNWQPKRSIASSIAIEAASPFQPKLFSSYKTISFHSDLKPSIIGVGPCFSLITACYFGAFAKDRKPLRVNVFTAWWKVSTEPQTH